MAVKAKYRLQGIGSQIFRKTCELLEGVNPYGGLMLLEVEDPVYGTASEQGTRAARVRFYERLGIRVVTNFQYQMPLIAGAEPPKMILMLNTADGIANIDSGLLKRMVVDVYNHVYGKAVDDPILSRMLADLTNGPRIRLREI